MTETVAVVIDNNDSNDDDNDDDNNKKWKAVAVDKYGSDIVHATSHLYNRCYRDMVADGNTLGAMPTLLSDSPTIPCPWIKNKTAYFFVCLLVELKLFRADNELRLYLDARGERDLRNPKDSSIELVVVENDNLKADSDLISGIFVADVSMPGHHKGYLSFDAGQFTKPGKYYFTFADFRRNAGMRRVMAALEAKGLPRTALLAIRDYPEILLFTVPEEGGLEKAFADNDGKIRYTLSSSPFDNETEEDEQKRFAPFVGETVLKRHETAPPKKRKWWVGPNDVLQAEPQRALVNDLLTGKMVMTTFRDPS